jgi:hypothetical protein
VNRPIFAFAAGLLAIGSLVGCSLPGPIPVGTRLLGQVSYVGSATNAASFHWKPQPNDALEGHLPTELRSGTASALMASCSLDKETTSDLALVRFDYFFWRHGIVDQSVWAVIEGKSPVEMGNVVELELRQGSSKSTSRCAAITAVRSKSLAEGGCAYADFQKSAGSAGLRAFLSVHCVSLESEGWRQSTDWEEWTGGPDPFAYDANGVRWYKPPL